MLLKEKPKLLFQYSDYKKISTVIGTILYYLSVSAIRSLSAFAPYLVSYLYEYNSNLTIHYTYFIAPILFITGIFFAPFGGLTDRHLGPYCSIIIETVLKV